MNIEGENFMNMKYKSKKAIAVLLAALLTAVSIPAWAQAETLSAKSAKDIKGHWAEVQIQQGMEKRFINGFPSLDRRASCRERV